MNKQGGWGRNPLTFLSRQTRAKAGSSAKIDADVQAFLKSGGKVERLEGPPEKAITHKVHHWATRQIQG